MDQRRAEIERLYHAALAIEPGGRQAFLTSACAQDATLRSAVEALLVTARMEPEGPPPRVDSRYPSEHMTGTPSAAGAGRESEASQETGARIGPYRILRELGRGGMGIVYLARDPGIGREVAIKTIQLPSFTDPDEGVRMRGRFLREARAAGSLSHPGIVTVHHLGEHEGQPYIVMEFIDGGALDRYMPGSPYAAGLEPIVRGLRTVAEALDYAHSRSVVHRDIKPGNILIGRTGMFKVADFGIAKILDESDLSTTRGVIGTPMYLAPEQLRGSPASARSDQYALGVMAYHIAARRQPYAAKTTEELLFQIISASPPPPSSLNPGLHPSVDAILQRVLSKDPQLRFATCAEFVTALHAAVQLSVPKPKPAAPQEPVEPPSFGILTQDRPVAFRFDSRIWQAVAIVAALILTGWLVAYAIRSKGDANTPATPPHVADSGGSRVEIPPRTEPENDLDAPPKEAPARPTPETHAGAGDRANSIAPARVEPKGDRQAADELYEALNNGYTISVIEGILARNPLIDGTKPDAVPLTMAAFRCQTEAAKLLLAKGADPNAPYSTGMAAKFKSAAETPLDMAAQAGCLSVAQLLLEHGAKPNLIADWGVGGSAGGHDPALIHAIGKSEAVVRLLLDHGADPNLHAKYGVPALWQAASGCQGTIVGWLLERNAKVDEAGGSDMTPLMIAVQDGCDLVVTALLAKGAKVNQVDYSGETALYHLVNVGNFEDPKKLAIASALLKAGANPNLGLRKAQPPEPAVGITPLMLAVEHGMEETIRVLLENRADPNAVDSEGRNAIMHALQTDRPGENRAQSVELLLAHGAAVNTRDKRGTSALGYAKAWHGTEGQKIVELLRKAGGVE